MSANKVWQTVCNTSDLVVNSGICALVQSSFKKIDEQIAIFYLPNTDKQIYAVGNYDPIGKANVLYRGIVGTVGLEPVVSSPLFKQHFSLETGLCLQDKAFVNIYPVQIKDNIVQLLV